MKRNRLVPAVGVVGGEASLLKWPNLVDAENADYVVIVQRPQMLKSFPIERAIAMLERGQSQFLSLVFEKMMVPSVPLIDAVVIRADLFSAYQLAGSREPLIVERVWAIADNPLTLKVRWRDAWRSNGPLLPAPKSDLAELKRYLTTARELAKLIKQTRGDQVATDFINENVIFNELILYFHAINREPVLYFANLKLLLVHSGIEYRGELNGYAKFVADVLEAVKHESRAKVLRMLGDSPETSLFY